MRHASKPLAIKPPVIGESHPQKLAAFFLPSGDQGPDRAIGGSGMRINYWQSESWPEKTGSCEAAGISITEAKKQLRKKGGRAFTAFFDRNGGLLETREIDLKGNNVIKTGKSQRRRKHGKEICD
jgi:hypothetical protein